MSDTVDDSPPVERYYTYKEAALVLHMTYDSLRTLIGQKQFERYRVRRRRYNLIPERVIREYLQKRLVRCKARKATVSECLS